MANGILKKIHAIQGSLEIAKSGYDERNDYYYFRGEDIATGVRKAMDAQKVIHRVEIIDTIDGNRVDGQGRERARITNKYRVIFIDIEDGSEFPVEVVATGSDIGGDKHTRKAAIQAFKIAAVETFIITEDVDKFDSDNDEEREPEAPAAEPGEKPLTTAQLNARVSEIVKDESNPILGNMIAGIGNGLAEKLGVEQKSTVWKKESEVMKELVKILEDSLEALKTGAAADIDAAIKLATTGEVE